MLMVPNEISRGALARSGGNPDDVRAPGRPVRRETLAILHIFNVFKSTKLQMYTVNAPNCRKMPWRFL